MWTKHLFFNNKVILYWLDQYAGLCGMGVVAFFSLTAYLDFSISMVL